MSNLPKNRYLIFFLDALIFAFCLLGVQRTKEKADVPAFFSEDKGKVVVREINSKPKQIALQAGDVIRKVNGNAISSPIDIEFILNGLQIRKLVTFEIKRNSVIKSVSIVTVPYYGTAYLIIQLIVGSLFFFVGLLILIKRPREKVAIVFHTAAVLVALLVMTTPGRYSTEFFDQVSILYVFYSIASAFVPALFVHFTFLFPRPRLSKANKLLWPIYILAVLFSLWLSVTYLFATLNVSLNWFHRFGKAYDFSRWFFSLSIVFAVGNIVNSYRTAVEESERRKLRWVLLGFVIGPPTVILLWQIPILINSRPIVSEEFTMSILSVVPVTFAISIIRYRLMDIDLIFNRSSVYLMVLIALLGVYATVVGGAAAIIEKFTVASSLVTSAGAAIVVALLFQPIRRMIQHFVDKTFFRVRYNFKEVQRKFIDESKHCFNVQQLANLVVGQTDELFMPERIGFFTFWQPEHGLRLLAHKNFDLLETYTLRFEIEKLKSDANLPVALDEKVEPGTIYEQADREVFQRWGIALAFPMVSEASAIIGFLVLGQKKSGTRYSLEDVDLLSTLTSQAAMTLERINLQQRLLLEQAEAQRLQELSRLKSHFVSSVSHELKTPLTSIKMFAEILRSKKNVSDKEALEYFEIIEGESDRLARLINNVLDFAKVEQGVKEYRFSQINLNDLVESVLRLLRYQLKMKEFTVNTILSEEEFIILADVDATTDALINICSNAIKYSGEDKKIMVSTFPKNGFAAVKIEDRGIGISEEDLKNIFEPFYRAKDAQTQQAGGAGLGLALVKHTMDAHEGKIEVQSTPGKGSCFTLLFPLERKT